jgi:hypothetical protein
VRLGRVDEARRALCLAGAQQSIHGREHLIHPRVHGFRICRVGMLLHVLPRERQVRLLLPLETSLGAQEETQDVRQRPAPREVGGSRQLALRQHRQHIRGGGVVHPGDSGDPRPARYRRTRCHRSEHALLGLTEGVIRRAKNPGETSVHTGGDLVVDRAGGRFLLELFEQPRRCHVRS